MARNVVRKFVVDRRSTTVLDGSATVLSRPHYGVWRLSKITYDCRRMTTFHQNCNGDWQRWNWGQPRFLRFQSGLGTYRSNINSDLIILLCPATLFQYSDWVQPDTNIKTLEHHSKYHDIISVTYTHPVNSHVDPRAVIVHACNHPARNPREECCSNDRQIVIEPRDNTDTRSFDFQLQDRTHPRSPTLPEFR